MLPYFPNVVFPLTNHCQFKKRKETKKRDRKRNEKKKEREKKKKRKEKRKKKRKKKREREIHLLLRSFFRYPR
jgi:hypothetical protein